MRDQRGWHSTWYIVGTDRCHAAALWLRWIRRLFSDAAEMCDFLGNHRLMTSLPSLLDAFRDCWGSFPGAGERSDATLTHPQVLVVGGVGVQELWRKKDPRNAEGGVVMETRVYLG